MEMKRGGPPVVAILAIFVLSGAAGLMYEVVWARQLVLVFGNTTQAVSTILTGFFGGMAIGSVVGGRLADRVHRPLRLYGLLELALVVVVLVTPITFRLIHDVYRGAFGSLQDAPTPLALLRFGLALLALAPATVLMGATLPTLTRYLTRDAHLSRAFGRLYAANTWGAVFGTVLAGLVLIELLGLSLTLVAGAACSATAGVVALVLDRWRGSPEPAAPNDVRAGGGMQVRAGLREAGAAVGSRFEAGASRGTPEDSLGRSRIAFGVAFVSGLTSLGYQVLWTRLLASGTGNATYVFTLILAVFLVGLAVGAAIFAIVRSRIHHPILVIAGVQAAVACLVLGGLWLVLARPAPLPIHPGQIDALMGALWGSVVAVVLPATIVMGIGLPAASALLAAEGRIASRAGQLLAANTLGAIVGTFIVPFAVIPLIGSPRALVLLALVNAALGLGLAWVAVRGSTPAGVAVSTIRAFVGGVAVLAGVISALGLARIGLIVDDPSTARIEAAGGQVFASAEDEIASVQAGEVRSARQLWVTGTSMTLLTIDARLMPVLPLIARPNSTHALTIAFGMGSAFRTALIAGLTVDAVELVPSVPKMFGYFYPDAAQVLANPRGRVIVADGRNYVELTDRTYDIIVVDPPPPIESSGTAVLYSREFYAAAAGRLNPGGVMMEWMPYGQTIDEFRAHVRTFHDVFPDVTLAIGPGGYGFFMLGSADPISFEPGAIQSILSRPGLVNDLSSAYDARAHSLEEWAATIPSLVLMSGDQVDRFAGSGPLITDDRPLPEYFLLRHAFGPQSPTVSPEGVRAAVAGP